MCIGALLSADIRQFAFNEIMGFQNIPLGIYLAKENKELRIALNTDFALPNSFIHSLSDAFAYRFWWHKKASKPFLGAILQMHSLSKFAFTLSKDQMTK